MVLRSFAIATACAVTGASALAVTPRDYPTGKLVSSVSKAQLDLCNKDAKSEVFGHAGKTRKIVIRIRLMCVSDDTGHQRLYYFMEQVY